jgi:hypothetical protein
LLLACTALVALVAVGCGEDTPDKGSNNGEATVTCGEGTVLEDGVCVASDDSCPSGEVRVGEECRPLEDTCGEGTVYDTMLGACIPTDEIICGQGTEELDGECIPVEDICDEGTRRDPETGLCVVAPDACNSNTVFDPDLDKCVPSAEVCDAGTYFDDSLERCRPGRAVYGDCSNLVLLQGPIESDIVLPAGECYRVEDELAVRADAQMTIEAGVVIVFEQGAGLTLDPGKLVTNGTEDRPVYLTGRDETPGHWVGINADESGTDALELNHTVVDWAGASSGVRPQAAVLVRDESTLTGSNLRVEGSSGFGIYQDGGQLRELQAAELRNNTGGDVAATSVGFDAFDANSIFASDAPVEVRRGAIDADIQWRVPATYRLTRDLDIPASHRMTIAAGIRILIPDNRGIRAEGTLVADGTDVAPIVFESEQAAPGTWEGIFFLSSTSPDNRLRHVVIRHAGNDTSISSRDPSLFIEDSVVEIDNVRIEDGVGYGVEIHDSQVSHSGPLESSGLSVGDLYVTPNVLGLLNGPLDLESGEIHVDDGILDADATWDFDQTLVVFDDIEVATGATLTVGAGSTLLFDLGRGLSMESGVLNAVGTSAEPITFGPRQTGAGNWRGLFFDDSRSPDNALEYVSIVGGGGEGRWISSMDNGNLTLRDNAELRLNNVTMETSAGPGIAISGGATATDCTMVDILDTPAVTGTYSTLNELCGQ